jgi:GGDEF domain-containing protein
MLIANPIYDTVFKYLMENLDIAKGIISTIINEEIDYIEFSSQEKVYKKKQKLLTVYHLDFIAKVREKEGGGHKNVLIELQKANIPYDIMRFRKYLGEQYKNKNEIIAKNGAVSQEPLPIITIYFLGFYISETLPSAIKVNREYIDLLGGTKIKERNEFIECLSHDSYVIQVPGLKLQMRIFKQENFIDEDHHLKGYEYETEDELMKKILKRLEKAASDKELLEQIEMEEMAIREYECSLGKLEKKLQQNEMIIEENKKTIAESKKTIAESKKTIAESKKTIAESKKTIAEKDKTIEEKDKALDEKNKTLEEKEKLIQELLKKLERH